VNSEYVRYFEVRPPESFQLLMRTQEQATNVRGISRCVVVWRYVKTNAKEWTKQQNGQQNQMI